MVRRGGRPTWAPLLVVHGSWLVHLRTPQSAFGGQLPFAGEPFGPQELNDKVISAPDLPGRERLWLVTRKTVYGHRLLGFCVRRCSIWHHMQGGGAYVAKDRRSSMTRSYPRRICRAGKEKNAGIAGLCRGFSTQSARQRQAEMAARIELLRSAKKHPIRRSVRSCVFS